MSEVRGGMGGDGAKRMKAGDGRSAVGEYDDIINMTRPESARAKMPREERAAQFAPFAALVGFARRVREMGAEHLDEVANEVVVEWEEEILSQKNPEK